jgi:hypothetical protein
VEQTSIIVCHITTFPLPGRLHLKRAAYKQLKKQPQTWLVPLLSRLQNWNPDVRDKSMLPLISLLRHQASQPGLLLCLLLQPAPCDHETLIYLDMAVEAHTITI